MRQVDLAGMLDRPQSFVAKYEAGERRLDVIESCQITRALGIPLQAVIRRLELRLGTID